MCNPITLTTQQRRLAEIAVKIVGFYAEEVAGVGDEQRTHLLDMTACTSDDLAAAVALLNTLGNTPAPKFCPACGTMLQALGDIGIVDWDSRWEVQTTRYQCPNGHMVFTTDEAKKINEAEAEDAGDGLVAFVSAGEVQGEQEHAGPQLVGDMEAWRRAVALYNGARVTWTTSGDTEATGQILSFSLPNIVIEHDETFGQHIVNYALITSVDGEKIDDILASYKTEGAAE